jgi:heptose-I-phosphate ethanolaminephosphotransferase
LTRPTLLRGALYAAAWFAVTWLCLLGGEGEFGDRLVMSAGLSLAHGALATFLAGLPRRPRALALAVYVPVSVAFLLLLLFGGRYLNSGGLVGLDALRAVAQTDPAEALAYVQRLVSGTDLAIAAAIAVLLLALIPRRNGDRLAPAINVMLLVLATAGALLAHAAAIAVLGPVQAYVVQYRAEQKAFRALVEAGRARPAAEAVSDFQGTVIVVLGESITRRHMGAYGYFRDTTPWLDARSAQWVAFGDVISSHSHTIPALTGVLTSAGAAGRQAPAAEDVDILSLARSAGFRTHWLSNHNQYGVWDNPITAIAQLADERRFYSIELGQSLRRSVPDQDMLPALEELAVRPGAARRLAFVHLFTNHWPYCTNYGAEFRHFRGGLGAKFFGDAPEPPDIDCYDNGVRYADWLVERVVAIAGKIDGPAAVVYFSDHGEAPLLGTGHESSHHSSYHIEIPMLLWTNEAFARRYPAVLAAARANADRPYSTVRFFHALADLLDIRHPAVRPEHSLFSAALVDMPRTALGGSVQYDRWASGNDVRENAAANLRATGSRRPAVWAHRINTLGALHEAAAMFGGVEMDLVYMDPQRCFHVYHAPARDTSLTLGEALEALSRRPGLRLWLDWKNATAGNIEHGVRCLSDLDRRFGLRGRALVETGPDAVFPEVRRVSEAGFRHGYYLPTEAIAACMKACDETRARDLARTLRRTVEEGGFAALTFEWRLKPFVERWLLQWAKERGLGLYSWDLSINVSQDAGAPAAIEQRFRAMPLEALLVTFPSPFRL